MPNNSAYVGGPELTVVRLWSFKVFYWDLMRRFYNWMVQLSVSNLTKGWWDTTQLSIKEFLHLASIMRNSIHHTQGTILVRSDQRPIPHQKLWQPDGSGRPFKELKEKKNWEQRNFSKEMLQKWKKRVSLWPVTLTMWEAPSGLIMWECMSVCMSRRVRPAVSPTVWDTGFSLIDKCPTPSPLSVRPESVSHRQSL